MVATATLIVHSDGYRATRKEVYKVKAPEGTDTWAPISHGNLIDMISERLKKLKIRVDGEGEFALAKEDQQMFGTFKLKSDVSSDFTLALGVRNSLDKSLSAGICCGSNVFVCDNYAFSSEIVFSKRHTPLGIEALPAMIDTALNTFTETGKKQEVLYDRMKKVAIPLETGIKIIRKMGEELKILPTPMLYKVIDEYAAPRFPEFKDRNAWTLMNACTTFCRHDRREIDPLKAQDNLMGITKCITDYCGLDLESISLN